MHINFVGPQQSCLESTHASCSNFGVQVATVMSFHIVEVYKLAEALPSSVILVQI